MDPNQPPDLSGMTGVPWLGRGRLQPEELALGRSRGLPLTTEGSGVGRARGFSSPGDTLHGRGVTQPVTEPVVGRARGLLVQPDDGGVGRARGLILLAPEPKAGVARGAILPSVDPQHGQTLPCKTRIPGQTLEMATLTTKEVRYGKLPTILTIWILLTSIKTCVFFCLQVDMLSHGQGTLVSMFRGMGIEPSVMSWGRGALPVGL